MARYKSKYIFGLHEPGGEHIMAEKGKRGWILFLHKVGLNPSNCPGFDHSQWANQGFGIISRLNHGYEPEGTIPRSDKYEVFAQCCANWARNSRGCHIWIIGNEMNYAVERPGVRYDRSREPPALVDPGEVITPARYARCYRLCREAIHRVPDHEDDEVLIGAVAPWNAQTTYDGNPQGDWVQYFRDILKLLGPENCDGITTHTYTHGAEPRLVYEATKLSNPPFDKHHYDFLTYRDFMNAIPASMRHLPVYITETDQDVEWKNENIGWVQRAYGEIDWWNKQPGNQQIQALILYRWPKGYDKWGIEGKAGVIEDFKTAMNYDYVWREAGPPPPPPPPAVAAYGVEWVEHNTPATMRGDSSAGVRLKLRNTGSNTWRRGGANPVRLGFHWYDGGRQVLLKPEQDMRTLLPSDVAPQGEVTLNAQVAAPGEAGKLTLKWDLVEEGVTWFEDRGSKPLSLAVTVEAPPPPKDQYFEATKQWVRGVFLDFYRRYGLDITGYPISEQFVDPSSGLPTQVFQRIVLEQADDQARLKLAGQYLQEAQQEIGRLKAQIEQLQKLPAGRVLPPPLQDVTTTLPREAARFHPRQPADVHYLVINHSGVSKDIDLQQIAVAHQRRGWPGISYQYYIDRQGQIFRSNPDLETVSGEDDWAVQGINVCFAGHFSKEVPNEAQLAAGGHLCAWLLQEYGLSAEAVVGINHFYATESPGTNWTAGANWRGTLLDEVQEVRAAAGPAGEELAQQVAALQSQVQQLQERVQALLDQVKLLQEENERLRSGLPEGGPVGPPPIEDISATLPREAGKFQRRQQSDVRYLVIHHTAVAPTVGMERVAQSHKARGWPGTLHHYFITGEGKVQQTNPLEDIVDASKEWLRQGINICFAGNFTQDVPGDAQLSSGARLCAWLLQELNLSPEAIKGAQEFYNTQSPGMQWQEGQTWRDMLLQKVREALATAGPPGDTAALRAQIAQLQASLSTAQSQAQAAVAEQGRLGAQVQQLQQEVQRLQSQPGSDAAQQEIARLQAQLASAQQQAQAATAERDRLQGQVQQLQQEVARLKAQPGADEALQQQIAALQAQLEQAQGRIGELQRQLQQQPTGPVVVAKPPIQDIVDDLPKHETERYTTRPLSQITHLSIHHSATPANIDPWRVAAYHIKADPSCNKDPWPGIGYHYYVEPDGTIYQTNRHETLSYHTGGNNGYGIGICFSGSFMSVVPTPKQIELGGHLVAWLMQELNIAEENVWGHNEFPKNSTSCPGSQWLGGEKWKEMLLAQVRAVQQGLSGPLDKSIRHYLLFWWRSPDLWARSDWANATNYIARFHPVCGFSEEAAKRAEYVLVVGGTAGVSWQAEDNLRRAGCKVERIEGVDEADTRRQLDERGASGRPFQTYEIAEMP
ncbi:MAG: N-acetylmuramoyl-L-alanine amidase [Chloroflexi bacterium]|nr:N-acetylmuramoyl-L-alanine amidase [Chloroflexota bacterium]